MALSSRGNRAAHGHARGVGVGFSQRRGNLLVALLRVDACADDFLLGGLEGGEGGIVFLEPLAADGLLERRWREVNSLIEGVVGDRSPLAPCESRRRPRCSRPFGGRPGGLLVPAPRTMSTWATPEARHPARGPGYRPGSAPNVEACRGPTARAAATRARRAAHERGCRQPSAWTEENRLWFRECWRCHGPPSAPARFVPSAPQRDRGAWSRI